MFHYVSFVPCLYTTFEMSHIHLPRKIKLSNLLIFEQGTGAGKGKVFFKRNDNNQKTEREKERELR